MQTLKFLAELIVQDVSFTSMADALNVRDYRTREWPPLEPRRRFPIDSPVDRRRPTHPFRHRMGIPQETAFPRRLEFLGRQPANSGEPH